MEDKTVPMVLCIGTCEMIPDSLLSNKELDGMVQVINLKATSLLDSMKALMLNELLVAE